MGSIASEMVCAAALPIEKCLDDFERHYRRRCLAYQKKASLTNLTPRQWTAAEALRENDNVIATETDKNMGGATIPRPVYNTSAIDKQTWQHYGLPAPLQGRSLPT